MKDEIMQRIAAVLSALNNVYVRGKQNMDNLGGSISILEELAGILNDSDITPIQHDDKAKPEESERR